MEFPAEKLRYSAATFDFGKSSFTFQICVCSLRFSIQISADNFVRSPIALQKFWEYLAIGPWEYEGWIANLYVPQVQAVLHSRPWTLADFNITEKFEGKLSVVDEKPVPGAFDPVDADTDDSDVDFDVDKLPAFPLPSSSFPLLKPSEVDVLYESFFEELGVMAHKVSVQGRALYYKRSFPDENDLAYVFGIYTKIAASGLTVDKLRTSRLYGIVGYPGGRVQGLLYDWIDNEGCLPRAVKPQTPDSLRMEWASQIKKTVRLLEDIDVAWGDVKARNVLIDKEGNAVVIHLDGNTCYIDAIKTDWLAVERVLQFVVDYGRRIPPLDLTYMDGPHCEGDDDVDRRG